MRNIKSSVTTVIIVLMLFSVFSGSSIITKANPIPWPSVPNQEELILKILTPLNDSRYNSSSEVVLNFTVTAPQSWSAYYWPVYYIGEIDSITIYMDSNLLINYSKFGIYSYFGNKTIQYVTGVGLGDYSIKLNQTSPGLHTLNITVLSYTYAKGDAYDNTAIATDNQVNLKPVYKYPNVVSDMVTFNVEQESKALASPSEFIAWTSIPTLIVIIIAALIYLKKRGLKALGNY